MDWYNVLLKCPNIQKIYVQKKDTVIVNDVNKLSENGYITEMKTLG